MTNSVLLCLSRQLRQNLDGLLNQLKNFPARLRQYASYEFVQRLLKGYLKINMLVIELKSEALKDRHWKQLMKRLHVNWVVSELTLGQIWDVDLQKNEAIVKDVLLVAQGEMALEEFLKQVNTGTGGLGPLCPCHVVACTADERPQ